MKKMRIYLDTSAIGYLDEQDSPNECSQMHKLWELIKAGKFDVVISDLTFAEITRNKNAEKVEKLLGFVSEINYEMFEVIDEANEVAKKILLNGILTEKSQDDCLHIGCAVVSECDVIVSMNFKHLVNIETIKGVRAITNLGSYKNIDIVAPISLIQKEGDD